MIQTTSRQAYLENLDTLGDRQKTVLKVISTRDALCNQEIAEILGWPINQVTGRTNELVERGLVEEAFKDRYVKTNRTVIFWRQKAKKFEQSLMQFAEVE